MRFAAILCLLGCLVPAAGSVGFAETPNQPAAAAKPVTANWAHIVLKGSYPEGPQTPGLFGSITEGLSDGLARLDKAGDDTAISGVILHIKNPSIGRAKQNEFRQAIGRLQKNGKKVYAWLDSGTSSAYVVASACDEIIMPESGVLMVLGMRAEVSFYKNLFDMIGVKADILRVGEFKSAAEPYTRTEMSPAFRKEMEEILDDYYRQTIDGIAKGRKLDRKQVMAAIDSGPHTARAAKKLGLINRVAYQDELESVLKQATPALKLKITRGYAKKKLDTDFSGFTGMIKMMNLLMGVEPTRRRSRNPKIAVIHATGMIMTGSSQSDILGGATLGSDTIIKAVKQANEDPTVKAIVLRVDSPGGSALASDLMWRALEKVEKPFVASMGDTAASGGYYISMGADAIFAEPGTLTGSIGVVGGKFSLSGLYEKIGITTTVIGRGKNSGILSTLNGFSDSERQAMMKLLYEIYDQFTKKAAKGRKMEHEKLEKLARGRVYTGAMALEIGLVDKLGTLDDAVAHAKELADIKPETKVERLLLPRPTSPFEALFGPLAAGVHDRSASHVGLQEILGELSPELAEHLNAAAIVNLLSRETSLTLLPFRLIVK